MVPGHGFSTRRPTGVCTAIRPSSGGMSGLRTLMVPSLPSMRSQMAATRRDHMEQVTAPVAPVGLHFYILVRYTLFSI